MKSLYSLLNGLTPKESSSLKDYLISPYFKIPEESGRFTQVIMEGKDIWNASDFTMESREQLWERFRPRKKFNYSHWRKYCSESMKIVEQFLLLELLSSKKDTLFYDNLKIEALGVRGHQKMMNRRINSVRKKITEDLWHQYGDFGDLTSLMQLQENYGVTLLDKAKSTEKDHSVINAFFDYGDAQHNEIALMGYVNFLAFRVIGMPYPNRDWDKKIQAIRAIPSDKLEAIHHLYLGLIELLENENLNKKNDLKIFSNHLLSILPRLSKNRATNFLDNTYSMATRAFLRGDETIVPLIFKMLKKGLKLRLWENESGELHEAQYKSIVKVALYLREFAFTRKFIADYKGKIEQGTRFYGLENYCKALLHFQEAKFSEGLKALRGVNAPARFGLSPRWLEIQFLVELGETESALSALKAYEKRVRREKGLSEPRKEMELARLKIMIAIIKLKREDASKGQKLLQATETRAFPEKQWMIKQLRKNIKN